MTSNELKSLVKEYFNLIEVEVAVEEVVTEEFATEEVAEEIVSEEITEETFGSIKDINGAFTITYPGTSMQIGDKVTVTTTEGQEMDAPDGTHELEDGTKIVTKDSVITEIMSADEKKELAEEAEEEKEEMEEEVEEAKVEEIVKEIAEAVAEQMKSMEEKMAKMEEKMAAFESMPAAEPTITSTGKEISSKFSKFDVSKANNSKDMEMAFKLINKRKK